MAQINTSVWGPLRTSENWQTVLGEDVHYTQNVNTTLNTGNDTHEPLDNSVCIFGFGETSPAVNAIAVSYNFTTEDYEEVSLFPNKTQIPWALAWADDASYGYTAWDSGYPRDSYVYGNNYRWVNTCPTEGGPDQEALLGAGTKPLWFFNNDFDYQKKWMVYVLPICLETHTVDETEYKEGKVSGEFVTLKDWYDNYKDKYQGICQIIMAPTTYNQNLPSNSGGLSFSLFAEIVNGMDIEYAEEDPRYNTQKIDGEFYAYRTYTGAYSHIEGDYFNGYMTIAGGLNIRNDMNVNLGNWTPLFMPTVGDWSVHCILPTHVGGTGDGWGFFAGYNPGQKTYDEVEDEIAKIAAHMGTFFIFDMADKNKANDDINVFLGLLDADAVSTGNYTRGEDNRDSDQFNWDKAADGNYDPNPDAEIDDDSNEDTKNKTVLPTRGMLMPFTGSYVFDYLPLTGIINACTHHYIDMQDAIEDWNLNKEENEDSLDFESYLWRQWGRQANPVDCLQNITYYPFNIRPHMTGLTSTTVIQVGSFVQDYAGTGVVGSKVGATTTTGSIWCGNGENSGMKFPITAANDFRSYAPYVSATLYLPFCGSIELDPQVFVGRTIKVNYLVDWRTGVCLALVYRDNLVVEAVSGQMGNKVNLQMLDGTTWASQLANASVQESNAHFNRATNFFATVGGLVKIAAGAALIVGSEGIGTSVGGGLIASGVGSVANGLIKGNQIDVAENKAAYDIGTTPIPTRQISTASPAVNASNEMRVRLVVFRSEEEDKGNYAHTVGHACLKYGTLNNLKCTGYTVCQTIDTAGINATEAEKEKIRSLLMGGVYV